MLNQQHETQSFSMGQFVWWIGVVEDRMDPQKLGRVRVRIMGYHPDDKTLVPTDHLPWAFPLMPVHSASMNGIGLSPTGIVEGTWCVGFFRDGHSAQDPVIMGTMGGIPEGKDARTGFNDPNGVYPRDDYLNEPDTDRLSRGEKISETVVQTKNDSRDLDVESSLGDGTWSEPESPYGGEYPYNHVRTTESGHHEEFDDTAGAERYHRYHPKGGFVETASDGTEVRKIVKDKYEIVAGDEHVHVQGNVNITVDGNANVYVKGNSRMETGGNYDMYVHGNYQLKVGGSTVFESGGRMYFDAPRIDLNQPGPGVSF